MERKYEPMAKKALDDLYARFWTEEDGGHILPTHCGVVVEKPLMIWEVTMLLIAMETYYDATGDEETKRRIVGTWNYLKTCFTRDQMVASFGHEPNLALDDTGWDIMAYLMAYRFTEDTEILDMVKTCLLGAYDHWKDGELENGLWYNDWVQYDDQWKSSYIVSLLISALEYCRITKGTKYYSQEVLDQTLVLCEWVERDFRRDRPITFENGCADGSSYRVDVTDCLYWVDYNKDRKGRAERFGPSGGTHQHDIQELGSISALFANMGMAALNVKLFEMFGWERSLERALETSRSIETVYNKNGAYLNDRDPNTDATMLRYYIHTILSTDRGTTGERDMLFRTADNLYATGCHTGGLYYPWWSKVFTPDERIPVTNKKYVDVESIMINATGVTMICGAALLESLGYSPSYREQGTQTSVLEE